MFGTYITLRALLKPLDNSNLIIFLVNIGSCLRGYIVGKYKIPVLTQLYYALIESTSIWGSPLQKFLIIYINLKTISTYMLKEEFNRLPILFCLYIVMIGHVGIMLYSTVLCIVLKREIKLHNSHHVQLQLCTE